jgi:hypothetical protein
MSNWMGSGIRAMLRNPRYCGRVIWNQYEWRKDPDSNLRQRILPRLADIIAGDDFTDSDGVFKARWKAAVAERDALRAKAVPDPRANLVRLVTDALARYRALVDNLAEALGKDSGRAREALAAVFGTIPVDREGRARVTLDVTKVLEFAGFGGPRGLSGSGGTLCQLSERRSCVSPADRAASLW